MARFSAEADPIEIIRQSTASVVPQPMKKVYGLSR